MTPNAYLVSLIRTGVPGLVGAALAWLAVHGANVPAGDRTQVTAVATVVFLTLYYAVVRKLEARWPKLGVLLGYPLAPAYTVGVAGRVVAAATGKVIYQPGHADPTQPPSAAGKPPAPPAP